MLATQPPRITLSLVVIMFFALTGNASASRDNELPVVIPQPQHMRAVGADRIILGDNGQLLAETIAVEQGDFFDEVAGLLGDEYGRRGYSAGSSKPATTIVLLTRAAIELARASLTLTADETAALGRSDQAYIIRMQPGARAKVWIVGASPLGVYYGATALVQLMAVDGGKLVLPNIEVRDYPDIAGRMCADWVLTWDWEVNGYDWGDGLDAFIARCKSKIDMCSRYKVNLVRFLGGRVAPGPAYMKDRYARLLRFAPELNRYARRKGVALQYFTTSFGIDHYSWGLPYPEPWVLNRESYPDGKVYSCVGGEVGGCLSNDALIEIIIKRQKQLVQDIEPSSIYLHNIDIAMYKDLASAWKKRCPRCRERFPDDEPYAARGYAAAVANLYNRITAALRSVKSPAGGYDASRDLAIVFASPGYSYWSETDAEWESDLKYFSQIARQVKDKRNVQLTFREQYNRLDGRGLRTKEMARSLEQAGWPNAMFMFAVQGADFLDSPNMFTSSPVLTDTFGGCGTLYNFNGHAFSELQVLANVNYAWNHHAAGWVDPGRYSGGLLREESTRYSTGRRHSEFLYGRFMDAACAALYGDKAAPLMADLFRLERNKGPIVPLVAWIDYQWKNAAYDWLGQAERNQQAKKLADRAAAVCDVPAKADLVRLSRCLEVSSRVCLLCDAVYRQKLDKTQITNLADKLLAWLDENFQFQIAEPDGGDPGFWKDVVKRIRP